MGFIISSSKYHPGRYDMIPNINHPNSVWNDIHAFFFNFSQVTNQLPSSTLTNPYSIETFNSYVILQLFYNLSFLKCQVDG